MATNPNWVGRLLVSGWDFNSLVGGVECQILWK